MKRGAEKLQLDGKEELPHVNFHCRPFASKTRHTRRRKNFAQKGMGGRKWVDQFGSGPPLVGAIIGVENGWRKLEESPLVAAISEEKMGGEN